MSDVEETSGRGSATAEVEDEDSKIFEGTLDEVGGELAGAADALDAEGSKPLTRREQERALAKELREIKERRLAKLAELRKEAEQRRSAVAADSADKRLEFLTKQAELYMHFMHAKDVKAEGGEEAGAAAAAASPAAGAAGRRGHRTSEKQEDDELVAEAAGDAPTVVHLTSQPTIITGGTMREYQLEGLNWMINLHDNNISGILADEMGLGKTLQSISLLAYLKEYRAVDGPHLVLVPKSVLGNWAREFKKWCPTLKILKLHGANKEERQQMIREDLLGGDFDVCITTFETVCIEHGAFKRFSWYYVIIDEAHRIKNEKSVLAVRVRGLDTQYRLLLTGTPLQNNLHELWALLNFLLPDVFSSSEDFDSWFSTSGKLSDSEVIKKLHAILRPFLLRRLKVDVERTLLPKIETKLYIGMSVLQKTWYKSVLSKDATAINQIGGPDRVRLLNILMQLRKVCNHPYLFDGAEPGPPFMDGPHIWENCGKMTLLHRLLPKLKAQGSRVLIFTQMTRMLDILEDYCRICAYEYCRIDGNTSGEDRDRGMDEFNAPDSSKFIFLLSTRAGGLGINLYTADIVILYDSDWNPQMDLQAMDRAHRIGQKKQVRVFRFITEGTVEDKIVERAERKLFLDALVIQQGRLMSADKTLSKGELMTMVKFGADEIFRSGTESSISDADIDAILSQGEARTQAANEKLKRDMAHTLTSFDKLDFSGKDASMYLYGGEDYAEISALNAGGASFIDIGVRERKQRVLYTQQAALAAQYQAAGLSMPGRKPGAVAKVKAPPMHDFQFFNRKRIEELVAKENEHASARRGITLRLKEARVRESKEHKRWVKQRASELLEVEGTTLTEMEATDKAEEEWQTTKEPEQESHALEAELERLDLSPEERAEKEALIAEGFASWSKRDYRALTNAMERHGRANKDAILAEVAETTDKSMDEVVRYYELFQKRCNEIADWEKALERIIKGEQKVKRREVEEALIAEKVGRTPDPFRALSIPYTGVKNISRAWTEEEDRFLVCMLNILGYGAWDALKVEIRRSEQFRFNWFMKSRTAEDLHRRCDALIRILAKEAGEAGVAIDEAIGVGGSKGGKKPKASTEAAAAAGRKRRRGAADDDGADGTDGDAAPAPTTGRKRASKV